jgi:hypothetical protein
MRPKVLFQILDVARIVVLGARAYPGCVHAVLAQVQHEALQHYSVTMRTS